MRKAIGEHRRMAHHTLYQVSTTTALVEGIYQGAVRVGTVRTHGDLGLGTFEHLDGEMAIVDGHFFQVRSDGSVKECDDKVLSSFAVVTRFMPDETVTLPQRPDLSHLTLRCAPAFRQLLICPESGRSFLSSNGRCVVAAR
jgi:acetolactate decarboxylase